MSSLFWMKNAEENSIPLQYYLTHTDHLNSRIKKVQIQHRALIISFLLSFEIPFYKNIKKPTIYATVGFVLREEKLFDLAYQSSSSSHVRYCTISGEILSFIYRTRRVHDTDLTVICFSKADLKSQLSVNIGNCK